MSETGTLATHRQGKGVSLSDQQAVLWQGVWASLTGVVTASLTGDVTATSAMLGHGDPAGQPARGRARRPQASPALAR